MRKLASTRICEEQFTTSAHYVQNPIMCFTVFHFYRKGGSKNADSAQSGETYKRESSKHRQMKWRTLKNTQNCMAIIRYDPLALCVLGIDFQLIYKSTDISLTGIPPPPSSERKTVVDNYITIYEAIIPKPHANACRKKKELVPKTKTRRWIVGFYTPCRVRMCMDSPQCK